MILFYEFPGNVDQKSDCDRRWVMGVFEYNDVKCIILSVYGYNKNFDSNISVLQDWKCYYGKRL